MTQTFDADNPVVVVNIISTSFAGSTWLNLMLGAHPAAMSVGEVKTLAKSGSRHCALHGESCPVWSAVDLEGGGNVFEQLARLTGRRILIANNSVHYFRDDLRSPTVRDYYVELIRDGRAVTASYLRKKQDKSMWTSAWRWSRYIRRHRRLLADCPPDRVTRVYYEHLAADPTESLDAVCRMVGIDCRPAMQEFWEADSHYLGGNRGTIFALARKQRAAPPTDPRDLDPKRQADWKLDYYEKQDIARINDDRWRRELSPLQLRLFALAAGRLNRRLGYGPTMSRQPTLPDPEKAVI